MKTVSVSTTIARPREEVHAVLSDLPAHERFTDHFLVDWRVLGDDAVRVRVKGVGKHDGSEFRLAEITPDRIVEHGKGGKDLAKTMRGIWTLGSTPDGRTRVTFTNELDADGLADRLGWPLAKAFLKRNNGRSLERLREQLEQAPA
jgi:hypothetical protein